MMHFFFLIFLSLLTLSLHGNPFAMFNHSAAVTACENKDYEKAHALLAPLAIDNPSSPVLYDLGVIAYKKEEYEKAAPYFSAAASTATCAKQAEQSFFNLGNSYVKQKKLREALTAYDSCLARNATHERALHNKKIVEKMLQEEEQKKQEEKEEQKKEEKEEQEQEKQESEKNQDSDKNKQDQDNHNEKDKKNDSSDHNKKDPDKNNQDKNDQNKSNPDTSPDDNKQQESPDQKTGDNKYSDNKENQSSHKQQNDSSIKKNDTPQEPAQEPWVAEILERQDQADKNTHRRIMQAAVKPHAGDHYAHNNW